MVDAGQIPSFYDRLHHGDGQHAFFVQGSAAHHLGLCASSAEFVDVDSKAVWCGFAAYQPLGGSVAAVEAFAFSSCFAGSLLLAVRLASSSASSASSSIASSIAVSEVKEWLILQVDLSSLSVDVAGCGGFLSGRSLAAGSGAWASLLSQLRPPQSLDAVFSWSESGLALQRLGVRWSGVQCLRLDGLASASDFASQSWRLRMEVALTGRADAFPPLGVCRIEDALVVQKRVFWRTADRGCGLSSSAYAVQLTFVVFCRFAEEPSRVWSLRVRHLYTPEVGSAVWSLVPDERVRGTLCLEWRQVGSGPDFVLRDLELASSLGPVLGLQVAGGVVSEVDLLAGGAARWVEVWRLEDVKKDLAARRYWRRHGCSLPGVVAILDDDVDVTAVVEAQFLRVGCQDLNRVKHEMLSERLKEPRPLGKAVLDAFVFVDPYAEACQQKRRKLECVSDVVEDGERCGKAVEEDGKRCGKAVEEDGGSAGALGDGEVGVRGAGVDGWSDGWGWRESRAWGKKQRSERWPEWSGRSALPPPPPPPPPPRVARAAGVCVRSFGHLSRALPHVYGEAAGEERLRPLVELRRVLESCCVQTAGREAEFEARLRSLVWDCLPHLSDDGEFWCLFEQSFLECGLHAPEQYGLSRGALSCFGREDVHVVFAGFVPAAVRVRSADFASLSSVALCSRSVERLVSWSVWLKVLELPRVELFAACLRELPASCVNSSFVDGHGYHMPLLRLSDLALFVDGEDMCFSLLGEFSGAVDKFVEGVFDVSSCWWPTAVWNACCWSVQFMERAKGRVDLEALGGYFQLLNGVSRQFRKEALDLIVRIRDVQGERPLPRSFSLVKGSFLYAESVALVSFPAPKWPFE